jgi:hypothetical protein
MKITNQTAHNSHSDAGDYLKPWTKDDVDLLKRLSESGVSKFLIAKRLGRSYTTVSLKAVELGIKGFS